MSAPYLDINEVIGFQIESTAEWRRLKAKEFSDDQRNLTAAEELDRLAQEVAQLEGSNVHQRICKLMDVAQPYCERIWGDLNEDVSAALRSVGFHGGFSTGAELLEWYHDTLEEAVRETINSDTGGVDSTELAEQVTNDPAVKAAKKAYEDAYAKAYAEARKRLQREVKARRRAVGP
jgi:hypothetical protein